MSGSQRSHTKSLENFEIRARSFTLLTYGTCGMSRSFWLVWPSCLHVSWRFSLVTAQPLISPLIFSVLRHYSLLLACFSILSVHPYLGTLVPRLKGVTKDFLKFLAIVLILDPGFLATFAMRVRDLVSPGLIWSHIIEPSLCVLWFQLHGLRRGRAHKPHAWTSTDDCVLCVSFDILLMTFLISLLTNRFDEGMSSFSLSRSFPSSIIYPSRLCKLWVARSFREEVPGPMAFTAG